MFRKLTYLMMLILIGVGSAFGQTGVNRTWTGTTADLVSIDQALLEYKATNATGSVTVTIPNGHGDYSGTHTGYDDAIATVYGLLVENATTMPTNWNSNVTGTTVYKVSNTVTLSDSRTVSGTLVLVGDGTVQSTNANRNISLSGNLILQGDVVLDGTAKTRSNAFISGGGKLYMADNATIQRCNNTHSSNFGGAVYLNGSSAKFYMVGGVIGHDGSESEVYMNPTEYTNTGVDYTDCALVYSLVAANKNSAKRGGGIYLNNGPTAYINGGKIKGNEATESGNGDLRGGGGIFAYKSTVNMYGGEISYNLAIGGAGLNCNGGTVNISGGLFKWNCACLNHTYNSGWNCGGGIRTTSATINVTGGRFTQNRAWVSGTAIYVFSNSQLTFENAEVDHNYGCAYGALYVEAAGAWVKSGSFHYNVTGDGAAITCTPTTAGTSPGGTLPDNYTTIIGYVDEGTGECKGPEIYYNKALYDLYPHTYSGNLHGGAGGAIKVDAVNLEIRGGYIHDNQAERAGGAAYVGGGDCKVTGGTLKDNKVIGTTLISDEYYKNQNGDGGGIYVTRQADYETWGYHLSSRTRKTTIGGSAMITGNTAARNGGGLFVDSGEVDINGGTFDGNKALGTGTPYQAGGVNYGTGNGGGMYVKSDIQTDMAGGTLINNVAANNGGGLYLKGAFDMDGGSFGTSASNGNIATNQNGGGVYVESGNLTVNSGTFSGNKALKGNGGGFYVASGNVELIERTGQTPADVITINNVNEAKNGGGFFVNGGTITITGAEISGNKATANGDNSGNGGGVYSNGGVLTINNGDIDSNTATDGAGFFVNGGTLNLYGGTIGLTNGNVASNKGGGFYIKGGETYIKKASDSSPTSSIVRFNKAKYGAGLYVEGTAASGANHAQVDFENGAIKSNHAEEAGGGIYISQYATLTMTGSSEVTDNYVDQPGKGGGVYKTGETRSVISVSGNSLKITDNYVENEDSSHTVNNLFLYGPMDFLTVAGSQTLTGDIAVGISIDEQTKPLDTRVIHGEFRVLNDIFTKMKSEFDGGEQSSFITDDAHKYLPLFSGKPAPYTFDYIFFVKVCYSDYPTVPASYKDVNPLYIHNAEELAYFTMIVNGINLEEGGVNQNPDLEAFLVNDIVITETSGKWIPAGGFQQTGDEPYGGEFHGQGHTISGLYTAGLPDINEYGLFGVTSGAVIEDLNLTDLDIKSGESMHSALLIGEMNGGVVRNVVASGLLDVCGSGESSDGSGNSIIGGLVGELKDGGSIINSMAMAEINADFMSSDLANMYDYDSRTVGGLVGVIKNGTVKNSFANPKIIHGSWNPRYVGGLVAENHGTIENCYVRLERGITLNQPYNGTENPGYQPNTNHSNFGMFAGFNDGTIKLCYYPDETIRVVGYHAGTTGQSCPVVKQGSYDNTTCKIYHPVERPYTYDRYMLDNQVDAGVTEGSTLMSTLNREVTTTNGYSHWMRTKASDVNDDYPVLSFDNLISTLNYTTIGSKEGYDLDYDNRFNEVFDRIEEAGEGCLFVYRTPWSGTISSPASEIITADNSETGIKVFVEDGVALLQDADSKLINTYTCHEFDDETRTWHHISSALKNVSPIGFEYGEEGRVDYDAFNSNPCNANIEEGNYASFFPQGITDMDDIDLYCFYEPEYHWVNFKRNSLSHWYMNAPTVNLVYGNEENLVRGKGYLASFEKRTLLQAGGELNNGDFTIDVTTSAGDNNVELGIPAEQGTELKGYNLLGNPYQSYLDMTEFLSKNSKLFESSNDRDISIPTYAIYDAEKDAYVQGMASTPSRGSYAPAGILAPHEGFFIVVESETEKGLSATFTNAMRLDTDEPTTNSRAMQPAYPLVNLVVTDESGESDIAVAEFGRPQAEAAAKMMNIGANGKVYFHYNDDDCALLYLNEDTDQLPVRFDAIENGTYTMTWSTANATFSYLHLVDNMTGIDVDMLSSDAYTFTASSSDYKSRFKLMFAYTGVEENGAAETETFAFMHDGNLVVNGEGWLEVIDLCSRTIASTKLTNAQNTMSLPQAAQGVYVLRLTNDNQSKVQKIVIE